MLCQNCKKNTANTTITENINGKVSVRHLCADCAAKEGLNGLFGNMLGGLFSEFTPAAAQSAQCSLCGTTFERFAADGKAGCPVCYTEFYEQLLPSLQKIHGKTCHIGKRPKGLVGGAKKEPAAEKQPELTPQGEAEQLQKQLDAAVSRQDYEQAAQLRDRIKAILGGGQQ